MKKHDIESFRVVDSETPSGSASEFSLDEFSEIRSSTQGGNLNLKYYSSNLQDAENQFLLVSISDKKGDTIAHKPIDEVINLAVDTMDLERHARASCMFPNLLRIGQIPNDMFIAWQLNMLDHLIQHKEALMKLAGTEKKEIDQFREFFRLANDRRLELAALPATGRTKAARKEAEAQIRLLDKTAVDKCLANPVYLAVASAQYNATFEDMCSPETEEAASAEERGLTVSGRVRLTSTTDNPSESDYFYSDDLVVNDEFDSGLKLKSKQIHDKPEGGDTFEHLITKSSPESYQDKSALDIDDVFKVMKKQHDLSKSLGRVCARPPFVAKVVAKDFEPREVFQYLVYRSISEVLDVSHTIEDYVSKNNPHELDFFKQLNAVISDQKQNHLTPKVEEISAAVNKELVSRKHAPRITAKDVTEKEYRVANNPASLIVMTEADQNQLISDLSRLTSFRAQVEQMLINTGALDIQNHNMLQKMLASSESATRFITGTDSTQS